MVSAVRIQQQIGMQKFKSLNPADKRNVLFKADLIAKDRGFKSEYVMQQEKPHIWKQIVAEVVSAMFP